MLSESGWSLASLELNLIFIFKEIKGWNHDLQLCQTSNTFLKGSSLD